MTTAGWFILVISVGGVLALFLWCAWKVLSTPEETKHVHGFESSPPDVAPRKKKQ